MPPRKKAPSPPPLFPPELDHWPAALRDLVQQWSGRHPMGFILVDASTTFADFVAALKTSPKPWQQEGFPRRFAVLWHGVPISPLAVLSWRNGLIEEGKAGEILSYRFFAVKDGAEADLGAELEAWIGEKVAREPPGFAVGAHIRFPDAQALGSYHPGFLTISPGGKLEEVFEELDECRRRYAQLIGPRVDKRREEVLQMLRPLLAIDRRSGDHAHQAEEQRTRSAALKNAVSKTFQADRGALPRVLLLGESGTGKTLVARYLAWRLSPPPVAGARLSRPFKRISLPEYYDSKNQFEYDLFGYRAGAYTDGDPAGSLGFLLERMGGVVFFDEIGDASPNVQEKLLAFLDDYCVTPRGWNDEPIFCPMLVVAATNQPIEKWADQQDHTAKEPARFRNDLFQRFNALVRIPGLNERRDELPFILDAMLQMPDFNPGKAVGEVGADALGVLRERDFSHGNFRLLERMVRKACLRAVRQGRDYLTAGDWATVD
jgi:hypothetical protein